MVNDILKFFEKVDEDKSTFFVSAQTIANPQQKIMTIHLDKEDMDYLTNKYYKLLIEERDVNVHEIKKKYNKYLNK